MLRGTIPAVGDDDRDRPTGEAKVEFDLRRPDDAPEPRIEGEVKFQTEPERDTVRVRIDEASVGAMYRAMITRPHPPNAIPFRATLDAEHRAALLAGELYVNVHTERNPRGEIRGQILAVPEPVEFLAELTADEDGEAESEQRGRPVLPLGATSLAELGGTVVTVMRIDETPVLVLSGVTPRVDAPPPVDIPELPRLEIEVALRPVDGSSSPGASGKVELEEQDDEHEIEVEIQDLVRGAAYRVVIGLGESTDTLFDGDADSRGDIRQKRVVLGAEPLPLGVTSFAELDGAVIEVLDAGGMIVLSGTIAAPSGGGAGLVAAVDFSTVGDYDSWFYRGDITLDATLNISDVIRSLDIQFRSGPRPLCMDAADSNDDGRLDISDAVHGLLFLFGGGTAPPFPGPVIIGYDLAVDGLFCSDD